MYTFEDLLELAGSSGAGLKSDKQGRHVRGHCTDSFRFFRIPLDETITNTYFLAPFYCSRQLNHCLEMSMNKNNFKNKLRLKSPKNCMRTAQPRPNLLVLILKKCVY